MKKHLILVKHSLPKIVKHIPANKWKLSVEGKLRSHRLAESIKHFQPETIASSNEPKARETAEIIAGLLHLRLHIIEDLHEHDRTDTPYLAHDRFQASIREFFQRPDQLIFGTETANEAHARFARAVHSVLEKHMNKTVVTVAHGTVISLFVSRCTGLSELFLWKELGLPSFVVLDRHSNSLIAKVNIA
jgi:broad specificity phosphatase PhoE